MQDPPEVQALIWRRYKTLDITPLQSPHNMSLFLTMLPFYLMSNLHCIGMCGPLVFMLAQHRFRYLYFIGRTISFALCGLFSGALGSVLNIFLNEYHVSSLTSFLFGGCLFTFGLANLYGIKLLPVEIFPKFLHQFNHSLSVLMLRDHPWPTFLFGFFTVALPCGQTLIVFSACALYGNPYVGFINGLCFALLTSPSLVAAMQTSFWLHRLKPHYKQITAFCAIGVGLLAICRGLADLDIIPHLILNEKYHFIIY